VRDGGDAHHDGDDHRLLLTYKFGALLFTQILRVPHLRVKAAKKEILLCQCDKNSYSYAPSIVSSLFSSSST
jgi:hypothetical protein